MAFKTATLLLLALCAIASVQAYDEGLARELLRASSASYCKTDNLNGMKCGDACNNLKGYRFAHQYAYTFWSAESVSYSLFINDAAKRIVVAFRGTQGATQLTKEALQSHAVTYALHSINNAVATSYFYVKYRDFLRGDFMNNFKSLFNGHKNYQVLFTGHSLGGAFATHAALDVSMSSIVPKNQIKLYTFGSPRVGDYNLASAVVSHVPDSWRVTHSHDLVPHLPPCLPNVLTGGCAAWANHPNENGFIAFNAFHTWPEVHYGANGGYKICRDGEDKTCANQYPKVSLSIADHLSYLGVSTKCLNQGVIGN